MTHDKTCTCGTVMDFVRGYWDGYDSDGNRAWWVPAHWVCPDCGTTFSE